MKANEAKKYMNIPMTNELYDRAYCKKLAEEIVKEEKITGMTLSQLSCEIFAHAYIFQNFRLVPRFLRDQKILRSIYNSASNGVDLEDDGDKWYRRIAYRVCWILPAYNYSV